VLANVSSDFQMHRLLLVHDIPHLLACELVGSELKATAVSLACCCRTFEDPVLNVLWETQDQLTPLLKCLPQDAWKEGDYTSTFVSKTVVFDSLSALNRLF
jgi:hypothetical protein